MQRVESGFTLVELVVLIVIVGVMGAVVVPRFSNVNAFDSSGFSNQLRSNLRYAQKSAIALRRQAIIDYSANGARICSESHSAAPVCGALPADCSVGGWSPVALPSAFRPGPSGVVATGRVCFNSRGEPYPGGASIEIEIKEGTTVVDKITVEDGTGYVH